MLAYDPLAFGHSLREHRKKLGWSAIQLSELYAEFVGREDSPPNPAFIYHLERGTTLVSQERRAILASLVGMPLVTPQGGSTPLDILEYMQALEVYCDQYRQEGTLKQERGAIGKRVNHLEAATKHSCVALKKRLLELFGFYQIILAFAWGDGQSAMASALLLSTIELAKEEKFTALSVYALMARAGMAMDRFELTSKSTFLEAASHDIHSAPKEQDHLEPLYAGLLYVKKGLLDAYTASDRKALFMMRKAKVVGAS